MNILRRLTQFMTRQSGWKLAVIAGFSVLLVLSLLLARAHTTSAASVATGPTITSDQADYQPGVTVTLTGAGWASGEAVHIFVNDTVGNTWSLNSNPDPIADTNGGFTYQFSLPASFISSYTVTATGQTSGTATTTFTDNPCGPNPTSGNPQPDPHVGATFTPSGNTTTYTFSSATGISSISQGVPGLIEYCVYPSSQPGSVTVNPNLKGADGQAWTASQPGIPFSFNRPGGDPSNVPFDGNTYTMGTATWSGNAPTSQTIVLHVNDPAFCNPNNIPPPNGSNTCFVTPALQQAKDLTVSKTATPSFTRTYKWSISKSVDNTQINIAAGGSATFNYTVSVTHDSGTDSGWQVTGTITVTNPNGFDVSGVTVTDTIDNNGSCTLTNGTNVTVPKNSSVNRSYTCTFSSNPGSGTNTAKATWPDIGSPSTSATGMHTYDFSSVSPTVSDGSVTVNDTLGGSLGTVSYTDSSPKTFTYSHTFSGDSAGTCTSHDNTATFTTNTSGTTGSASQKVEVCGPAKTGALTMGFWQNMNGQGIITGGASTSSVCNSGTWLRKYAPFQDLSSSATCSQVATYVTNVIKAATCSGSTCNAMLKAQMLATALDVYFSNPVLGGNKINAPAPIGGVTIDLTKICTDIPTCTTFVSVSSAFGGATSLTVSQMLAYAASQSNLGGTTWYGNVKATQVLAKDAFDAINNQVAFAP